MTHAELLEHINKDINEGNFVSAIAGWFPARSLFALRAVVELHKPKEEDGKLWCSHEVCYNHIEFLERNDCDCSYPCPTIQAIEKELA